jgi:hypothetical protein
MCEGSMQCAAPSAFQAKYPDLQKPPGDRTIFQAINRNSKGSTLDVGGNPATIVFLTNRQFFVPRGLIWQMKAAMCPKLFVIQNGGRFIENKYSNPINMIIGWLLSNDLLVSAADDFEAPAQIGQIHLLGLHRQGRES